MTTAGMDIADGERKVVAGSVLRPSNIDTIAPDFETMYAIHANIQLEQAITKLATKILANW
ncbi:MAG: hypothetical protein LC776_10750 [Acidobacteria bacterium]|nr:hypothetical protein [Acidobacteriota bacterium]